MAKSPTDIDRQVGARVRLRRLSIGMSQEKLGDALGVTFQQVQKYENGTNRISVGRLHKISDILKLPFVALMGGVSDGGNVGSVSAPNIVSFLTLPDAGQLIETWLALSPALRRHGLKLIQVLKEPGP